MAIPQASAASAPTTYVTDGGFEGGASEWKATPGVNMVAYRNGQVAPGIWARTGERYLATNAPAAGGSVYQDRSTPLSRGDTLCASAYVRTEHPATSGAAGSFAVWLLGGSKNERGVRAFSNLAGGNSWRQVSTCATATTAHSLVRVEFYPQPGTPTLNIDDIDVHFSRAVNAGFEDGASSWQQPFGGTMAVYRNGQLALGVNARSGTQFLATKGFAPGNSVLQDMPRTMRPWDTYCATAHVRTGFPATTGAGGLMVIWLLGNGPDENGQRSFTNLPGGSTWTEVSACATSGYNHSTIRVEFYPVPGKPAVHIDDVDVHQSFARDASFEFKGGPFWRITPGVNITWYADGEEAPGVTARSGARYVSAKTTSINERVYQIVSINTGPGDTYCAIARLRTQHGAPRSASGTFLLWLTGTTQPEIGQQNFSSVSRNNDWTSLTNCVTATRSHSEIVLAFHADPGVALDIEDVDLINPRIQRFFL